MFHEETRTISRRVSFALLFFESCRLIADQIISRILEAVSLFSLSQGAVVLLLESDDWEQFLYDFHVETLPVDVVRAVLKKRLLTE